MNILLPVDGSKFSRAAVDFVASRTTLIGTDPKVQLLNVQHSIPSRAAHVVGKDLVSSYYAEEADKVLKPAVARLAKAGIEASTRVAVGQPSEEISAAAEKLKADLVVMGTHGQTSLKGLLLGSVTHGVMARCEVPLLIVRAKGSPSTDSLKVGIAVDGSKYGREAIKYVLRHGELFGANPALTLLHVVPDFTGTTMPDMAGLALPAFSEQEVAELQKEAFEGAVSGARKMLSKAMVKADEVRLTGNPGDELAGYARKKKLDVLVMGSHGHGAFRAAVLGSVATRVTAHCEVPVLLIRKA